MKTVLILGGAAALLWYLSQHPDAVNASAPSATTRPNTTATPGVQPAVSPMMRDPFRTLSARRSIRASAFGT